MFVGLNMKLELQNVQEYIESGKTILKQNEKVAHNNLEECLLNSSSLSAEKIKSTWFPEIKSDVFISHSHRDAELACALAGFLNDELHISSFVDSAVWGYANDLLKKIDDKYCVKQTKQDGYLTYDYDKRNYSTSHVHMMLNGALAEMMNNIECIIFLNTPNSITFRDTKEENYTDSPWIFSELLMAQLLEIKTLSEYRRQSILEHRYDQRDDNQLSIYYKVPMDRLYNIKFEQFLNMCSCNLKSKKALDKLYRNCNIIK